MGSDCETPRSEDVDLDYSEGQQVARRRESGVDRIGPYSLIAQIASGDFTTVHLAQRQGTLGYQRLTAIKRLRPELCRQPEWTQLLLDEARLSAGVRHGNIVDIIDVGTDPNSGVYLVMGYVEGADLEVLIARAGKERHPRYLVPPIVDALNGLGAVHTALDELGESLSMVHQAPRARHILIGIDGTARITDFSQVSARGLIPSTLRGKRLAAGYMAPEQVSVSEPVSARTDLFIVGITLWETLTGERLFGAENPALARRGILERHIPRPSEVGLRPPACFDAICMKALQRNPEQRYQSAHEMARELREAAVSESLYASSSELGQWVRGLASRALVERRRAIGAEEPSQEISLDQHDSSLARGAARIDGREPTAVITTGEAASAAPDRTPEPTPATAPPAQSAPDQPRARAPEPRTARSAPATSAAVEAIVRGFTAAATRAKPAATLMETRIGHPFAAESVLGSRAGDPRVSAPVGARADEARASAPVGARADEARASAPVGARADEARAAPRVFDAESAAVAQAITMDPALLPDDPSGVSRSITVPVCGPVDPPGSAPVGLPAPTATLLGVSPAQRTPSAPPPGLSPPRRPLAPSVIAAKYAAPPAGAGFTVPSKRTSMPTASFFSAPVPHLLSQAAASPTGVSQGAVPSSVSSRPEQPHAATAASPSGVPSSSPTRTPRKGGANATLPEGTVLSVYLPSEPPAASSQLGSRAESHTVDAPFQSAQAEEAVPSPSEAPPFTGFGYSAPSAGAQLPHDDVFGSRLPERVAPPQGGYRDERSGPARTYDGELPADIFARVQAARREATESFRPPAFAVQDHAWTETEPARGFGLKSLLVAAAIVATGVFGYRQWGEEQRLVRRTAAPVGHDEAAPSTTSPAGEPAPAYRAFEDLPGAAPAEPSAAASPRSEPVPPPLEVVPPPYGGEVPPPFVAPIEPTPEAAADVAPRRIAAARRSPRTVTSLYAEPQPLAPRLPVRPRQARASDPALPDNPY